MSTKPKKPKKNFDDPEIIVSYGECTGLAPAGLTDDEQGANIAALYGIHPIPGEDEDIP